MTLVGEDHRAHDAVFRETPGGTVVEHYGRPERTHRAVRNGMGVIEMGYGIIEVTGSDRQEYVDNIVSNRVPAADGQGVYAVLLRPEGKIRADLYIYATGERLLLFTAADVAGEIAAEWAERTFIQDVEIREATTAFGVFGVHGPLATEKVASVLSTQTPAGTLAFDRGRMGDVGVTVIRSDDPTGQEGYEVVCAAADAPAVYDTLLYGGPSAVPVGYRTWETLTLEAGTPLFETELAGQVPNVVGMDNAVDFEKGCFVGQEVVSRVENRGQPSRQLVGVALPDETEPPAAGATVTTATDVGQVTRAALSPSLEHPVALAYVDYGLGTQPVTVEGSAGEIVGLPFLPEADASARRPTVLE
jgi:aminomethyltransferase